jgi:hypothetical protein
MNTIEAKDITTISQWTGYLLREMGNSKFLVAAIMEWISLEITRLGISAITPHIALVKPTKFNAWDLV